MTTKPCDPGIIPPYLPPHHLGVQYASVSSPVQNRKKVRFADEIGIVVFDADDPPLLLTLTEHLYANHSLPNTGEIQDPSPDHDPNKPFEGFDPEELFGEVDWALSRTSPDLFVGSVTGDRPDPEPDPGPTRVSPRRPILRDIDWTTPQFVVDEWFESVGITLGDVAAE